MARLTFGKLLSNKEEFPRKSRKKGNWGVVVVVMDKKGEISLGHQRYHRTKSSQRFWSHVRAGQSKQRER